MASPAKGGGVPSGMMPGQSVVRIGAYRLGKTIGVGSFGKVKLAVHESTGHTVAVKILSRKKIKSLDMDAKVRREINVLKLFRHPHIIKLYEVIETPTDIFLIMEHVSGGELFDFIVEKGKLSEDDARRFFQQIISGIDYCHKHMVVHRDLKPENLLLDTNLNVKIADFGLSNIMSDGNFLKTSCGSPNYAAPEVISGKLYAGPEVDVWSCGVILYALLCGRLPFDDDYIPTLFRKIKSGHFVMPTFISDDAKMLLKGMLTVDPLERMTVPEIRESTWFTQTLPPYLSINYASAQSAVENIDDKILALTVTKLGIDREMAIRDLQSPDMNATTVAYQLLLDNSPEVMQAATATMSGAPFPQDLDMTSMALGYGYGTSVTLGSSFPASFATSMSGGAMMAASAPGAGFANRQMDEPPSFSYKNLRDNRAHDGEYSSPRREDEPHSSLARGASGSDLEDAEGKKRRRPRWHMGLRSKKAPRDLMDEIYRSLMTVGASWKVVTPYQVRCLVPLELICNKPGEFCKIAMAVYRYDDRRCLVSVKRIEGDILSFFDVCAAIMKQMKI